MAAAGTYGWASTSDGRELRTLLEDWATGCLRIGAVAVPGSVFVLGFRNRRWFPPPVATAIALFLGCGGAMVVGARALSPSVRGPDGADYAFFHHEFMQMRYGFLGRVKSTGWFTRTLEVVESNEGEFGFCFAALVLPEGADGEDSWVAVTQDGLVLGVNENVACRAARIGAKQSVAGAELLSLSPFVLLGNSGAGVEADVMSIVERLRIDVRVHGAKTCNGWAHPLPNDGSEVRSGTPTETALLDALASPNAWIRDAARRIVLAGGAEVYPEATRRIAAGPK